MCQGEPPPVMAHWHSPVWDPWMVDAGSPGNKGALPEAPVPSEPGQALLTKEAFPEMSSHPSEALFHLVSAVQVAQQAGIAALTRAPRRRHPIGLALLSVKGPGNVNRSPPALGAGIRSYGTAPRICPPFICPLWPQTPWLVMYSS